MINHIVSEALHNLDKEQLDIEHRRNLIKSIDWTKPVTEDEWHALCETSARSSEILLSTLVKNIFPDAIDIVHTPNYVSFSLLGYRIQIPTSRCRGINIATNWYKNIWFEKNALHNSPIHSADIFDLKKYFDAKDQKLGWRAEAEARIHGESYYNDFQLFWLWFTRWKWKKIDRVWFETTWKEEEYQHNEAVKRLEKAEVENKKHLKFIVETLIPELNKFSTEHNAFFDSFSGRTHLSINDILRIEEMSNEEI